MEMMGDGAETIISLYLNTKELESHSFFMAE